MAYLELLLRTVFAFPNASKRGFDCNKKQEKLLIDNEPVKQDNIQLPPTTEANMPPLSDRF
jgi:hypothetical protein